MKRFGEMMARTLAGGAAFSLVLAGMAVQAAPEQGSARVLEVEGDAQYSVDGVWRELRRGSTLQPGAVVRTQAGSEVTLDLQENGPYVWLEELTTLALDELSFERAGGDVIIDTQLDLQAGRIQGFVRPMASSSQYEISIPDGVVGVRGTRYDVSVDGRVTAATGQLVVVYIDPETGTEETYVVDAGFTFDPTVPGVVEATPEDLARANRPSPAIEEEELPELRISEREFVSPVAPEDQGSSGGAHRGFDSGRN